MSRTTIVGLAVLAAIAVIVIVLATGGQPSAGADDATGDVATGTGEGAPADPGLADIDEATVRKAGDDILFEVTMVKDLPSKGSGDALSFRWELSEEGRDTWLVTADAGGRPVAALTSLTTNYGVSTIDETLPGSIQVEGRQITITIEASEIEGLPTTFGWSLVATLDADRADPASAVATDTAPDSGTGKVD